MSVLLYITYIFSRYSCNDCIVGYIPFNDGTGGHNRIFAYGNARKNYGACSDPCVTSYHDRCGNQRMSFFRGFGMPFGSYFHSGADKHSVVSHRAYGSRCSARQYVGVSFQFRHREVWERSQVCARRFSYVHNVYCHVVSSMICFNSANLASKKTTGITHVTHDCTPITELSTTITYRWVFRIAR